jgi:hypothetical protein
MAKTGWRKQKLKRASRFARPQTLQSERLRQPRSGGVFLFVHQGLLKLQLKSAAHPRHTRRPDKFPFPLPWGEGLVARAFTARGLSLKDKDRRPQGPALRATGLQLALKFLAFTAHRCYTNQQQAHDP